MVVRYLGHSCFFISSNKGTSLITDPYGSNLRYEFPTLAADIVTVSHEHRDHNADWRISGTPNVVKRTANFPVEHEIPVKRTGERLTFYGLPSFHDKFSGRRRGPNTIWHWYMDGIHFVHLGDLGHLLNDQQLAALEKVDVLFLPVGGHCVLEPTEAALVLNQLTPALVFPMHYKTPCIEGMDLATEPLESFLTRMDNVDRASTMAVDLDLARLPSRTRIVVLNYE
ncbi:MAG: MBL fold metallo-hydrolase [Armatimonadetes bacterium]|nr:MBL fold metallo-hydrolase [Armatimonadota bacterium]